MAGAFKWGIEQPNDIRILSVPLLVCQKQPGMDMLVLETLYFVDSSPLSEHCDVKTGRKKRYEITSKDETWRKWTVNRKKK